MVLHKNKTKIVCELKTACGHCGAASLLMQLSLLMLVVVLLTTAASYLMHIFQLFKSPVNRFWILQVMLACGTKVVFVFLRYCCNLI